MGFDFDIGFLGGGQLARMSIQAAQRMGLTCLSLDETLETPASQIAPALHGALHDPQMLTQVFENCVMVTLENEFVPAAIIRKVLQETDRDPSCLLPGVDALETIQDKLTQRQALAKAGVPNPKAVAIDDDGALAVAQIGFPMVLKARYGGYDGRGTRFAKSPEEFEDLKIHWAGGGWLAESMVNFKRELAVMVYRTPLGSGCFPTMETVQTGHVCDLVFPSDSDGSEVAMAAVEAVGGLGLFGVELFQTEDGTISVNEIAPRPHNSGHYTLDWGGVSQFDMHIRCVLGLPPVLPDGMPTAMANLLGQAEGVNWRLAMLSMLVKDPGLRFHWYGKTASRPGRKMGHINAVGEDARERVQAGRESFYQGWRQQPDQ